MFSRNDSTFAYLIGILILFFILIFFTINIFIPFLNSPRSFRFEINGTSIDPPTSMYFPGQDIKARLITPRGTVFIDLLENSAPVNVNNFVHLTLNGYYDGLRFHRAVSGFLVQGGDRNSINITSDFIGRGNTGYLVVDEINWDSLDLDQSRRGELQSLGYLSATGLETPKFGSWIVAMASSGPNTNSSQFFIITNVPSSDSRLRELDGKFTPIGRIIGGFEIVDQLINDININGVFPVIQKVEIYTN